MRATAGGDTVAVYANPGDPFRADTNSGGNDSVASQGAGPEAPTDLAPDLRIVEEREVELRWSAAAGAESYNVTVEVEDGDVWRSYGSAVTTETRARVAFGANDARYRWSVAACDASACRSSLQALVEYESPDSTTPDTTEPEGTDPTFEGSSDSIPAVPTRLVPAHETSVASASVILDWSDSANPATYNLLLRVLDPATNQWVDIVYHTDFTQSQLQVPLDFPQTWYAWTVQACNQKGCSQWAEQSLLYADR